MTLEQFADFLFLRMLGEGGLHRRPKWSISGGNCSAHDQ